MLARMNETNSRPDLKNSGFFLIILVVYFISEYLEHDVEFVDEVKHELVEITNETNSTVTKFKYFAD